VPTPAPPPKAAGRPRERAYAADWRDCCAFVGRAGGAQLPAEAETVALYVADLTRRGRRPATIARKLAAIAVYYRSMDHLTPTDHDVVRAVVRGTRRQLGVGSAAENGARDRCVALGGLGHPRGFARAGRRRCAAASSSRSRSRIPASTWLHPRSAGAE
jgi:hypothetical protein